MNEQNQVTQTTPHPLLVNGILGFFAAGILNAALTTTKEVVPAIKEGMANILFHHWVAHGIILAASFILFTLIFYQVGLAKKLRAGDPCCVRYTILGTIISAGVILLYYILHGMGIV